MRFSVKTIWVASVVCLISVYCTGLDTHADTCQVLKIAATGNYDPQYLTNVNGILFFSADDSLHNRELWKSDGTEAGTIMVKDIHLENDPGSSWRGSHPTQLTNVNGTLFFSAGQSFIGLNPIRELWKSDGTEAGTVMVKDLNAANPGDPNWLTNVNGTLFFTANDWVENELWKSDGTEAGTVMVKNIYEGGAPGNSSTPMHLIAVGNLLFFTAEDGVHGRELWKSDGTEAGTVMVEDIWGFTFGSDPAWLTHHGLIIAFSADDGLSGRELWGSALGYGAYLIKDIRTVYGYPELSSNPEYLTSVGGTLFFAATAADGSSRELWKSDGTAAGTVMVKDINPFTDSSPEGLTDVNGTLYFSADDGENGRELWKSDGTAAGTVMVRDINPLGDSLPEGLINVNGTLYFSADDGKNGRELWTSDGTSSGTMMVEDIQPLAGVGSDPEWLTNVNGTLFFNASRGLWKCYEKKEDFPWGLFTPVFTKKRKP
jgi:ELWxxDGT repeat protein